MPRREEGLKDAIAIALGNTLAVVADRKGGVCAALVAAKVIRVAPCFAELSARGDPLVASSQRFTDVRKSKAINQVDRHALAKPEDRTSPVDQDETDL